MCDLFAKRDALDAWLIPDVARIECLRELRLPKDIDYDEVGDTGTPYHITKITLKAYSLCVWRNAVLQTAPSGAIWGGPGCAVHGRCQRSVSPRPRKSLSISDVDDGLS